MFGLTFRGLRNAQLTAEPVPDRNGDAISTVTRCWRGVSTSRRLRPIGRPLPRDRAAPWHTLNAGYPLMKLSQHTRGMTVRGIPRHACRQDQECSWESVIANVVAELDR